MSSFPILHLPHLPLRDVIDCWNIFESYQFSRLFKNCKEVAKYRFKSTSIYSAELVYGNSYSIRLKNRETELHEDLYVECIQEKKHSSVSCLKIGELSIISENPSIDILKEMNLILEIFNCSLDLVSIDTTDLEIDQLKNFISWMKSIKQKSIPKINIENSDRKGMKYFLNKFRKPTDEITIKGSYNDDLTIEGNSGSSGFQCQKLIAGYRDWIKNEELFTLDFVKAEFASSVLMRSDDLNTFMTKWKDGESNLRMEECHFELKDFNLQIFSYDLSPVFETEEGDIDYMLASKKQKFNLSNLSEGNIQIKRNDGSIATVSFKRNYPISFSVFISIRVSKVFGPANQCQPMTVDYNHWIQNRELFTLDFVKADFAGYITSDDLNKFMRKWKEGKSNARMEECHFELENFNLQRFSVDLSPTFEAEDGNIEYLFDSDKKEELYNSTEGKVQVERDDGSIATIWFKRNYPISKTVSISIRVSKP